MPLPPILPSAKRRRRAAKPSAAQISASPLVYIIQRVKHGNRYRQFVRTNNPARDRKAGRFVVEAQYLGSVVSFVERKTFVEGLVIDRNVFAKKSDGYKKAASRNNSLRMIFENNAENSWQK